MQAQKATGGLGVDRVLSEVESLERAIPVPAIKFERRYISIKEACTRWNIGPTKLYELLAVSDRYGRSFIPSIKLGRRRLIDKAAGDAAIASLGKFGGAPR